MYYYYIVFHSDPHISGTILNHHGMIVKFAYKVIERDSVYYCSVIYILPDTKNILLIIIIKRDTVTVTSDNNVRKTNTIFIFTQKKTRPNCNQKTRNATHF